MQGVSGLLCVCAIFILLPQANCQTYSNVILNTWYEGSVNSSSGTISYQVSLPDHYKNNQTLFRIYNQVIQHIISFIQSYLYQHKHFLLDNR